MAEKSQQELSFFDWEKQMESGAGTNTFREPDANSTFERIYQVVCQIPKGKVATYGQVARLAGNKKWSRVVGYALHVNPEPGKIPCHRVVNRLGEPSSAFAFGGANRQIELLEAEGVTFVDGRVDMKKYQWEL
jgi:methylated-DNA-protein-cysteine methyltransferase-like protein